MATQMAIIGDYDSTAIDWVRLRQYAKKVAKYTKVPTNDPLVYETVSFEDVEVRHEKPKVLWFKPKVTVTTENREVRHIVKVIGSHWLIDRRNWERTEKYRVGRTYVMDTVTEDHRILLTPDGSLKKIVLTHNLVTNRDDSGFHVRVNDRDHSESKIDDSDVIAMDYNVQHRSSDDGRFSASGTRQRGDRLIRHAKGVGINLALRKILEV